MLVLSAVFMLMTFVVFVGYGLFAASIRDRIISRPLTGSAGRSGTVARRRLSITRGGALAKGAAVR